MGVSIFWNQGQIRWGKDHEKYGDEWETIVTIQRVRDKVFLSGGRGEVPPQAWREMAQALQQLGITDVEFERRRNGKDRIAKVRLKIDDASLPLELSALTSEQRRILCEALAEYSTAIPEDAVELCRLREIFGGLHE